MDSLTRFLENTAREAADFDRLKKIGWFRRNAERLAAAKVEPSPLPRPPAAVFAGPSVAIVDRSEPAEAVAEPNDAGAVSIRPLADFDDNLQTPETDPRQLWISAVETSLLEIAKRDTGDCADPAERAESELRYRELKAITLETADDLEAEGIPCYRGDEFVVWIQGFHSGIHDVPPRLAQTMMLPLVAQRARRSMLQAAECFLASHPFARTGVLTSGSRCKLRDLRERVREFHRAISRLNYELKTRFGLEIVLRSTELGTPEGNAEGDCVDAGEIERDADGDPTFHVHSHVIFHHVTGKRLSGDAWSEMLGWVSAYWGHWWKDCGILRDARETVKYITKPRELAKLTRAEKAQLFRQLRRMKLLQAMGKLREEIRSRHERRMRLDRLPTPEGRVWREVPDPNRSESKRPADAAQSALEHVCASNGDPFGVKDHERPERGQTFKGERRAEEPPVRCVAILPPMFLPGSMVREPAGVFIGKRVDLDAWKLNRRCVMVTEATRPEWLAGVTAARIMVHTCTPTVGPDLPGFEVVRVLESRPIPDPVSVFSV